MRRSRFVLLATVVGNLAFAAPSTAAAASLASFQSFDAARALPAELAREVQASPPGSRFRVTGLRGADGEPLTLELETARLFADDFHLFVDGQDRGQETAARLTFLRGTVAERPRSAVALIVDGATGAWRGSIASGETPEVIYELTLPAGATGAIEKTLAAAAVVRRAEAGGVARSALTDALEMPSGGRPPAPSKLKPVVPPGVSYQVAVAVESDYELFQEFGTTEAAAGYVAATLGGVSELYFRQLGVSLAIASLSLWTTPNDPWNAPNPHVQGEVLCEFSSYWQRFRPVARYPRNAAVFFTGKSSTQLGGEAWTASLCNFKAKPSACPSGAYSMMVILAEPAWDTRITAHELGHILGSRHTHCFDPPIDQCVSGEEGCYQGPESTPADGGSVMSYCDPVNFSMGEPGRFGLDSQRVEEVIGAFVGEVGPTCLGYTGAYALTGAAGPGSATLSWTDPFSTETGWLVEQRQKTGKFVQIRTLPANATGVTITRLKPGPNSFRIRAKLRNNVGIYSDVVTVTVP
jgi:hypothetical protein